MTIKKLFTVSAFVALCTLQTLAQKDSSTIYNNEFGIHVGSLISSAVGGAFFTSPVGISYKRVKGNWAFRTHFNYSNFGGGGSGVVQVDKINDSMATYNNAFYNNHTFEGGAGLEYRYAFDNGIILNFGGDVLGIFINERSSTDEFTQKIDWPTPGNLESDPSLTHTNHRNLFNERRRTTQFGISPSAGVMIPIGKRWWLAGNYRLFMVGGPTRVIRNDNITGVRTDITTSYFDFSSSFGFSEITLYFRF
jgi:hypothetical protein